MKDVFILTRTPGSIRAELCLELFWRSEDPRLYFLGDGVYHLLNGRIPARVDLLGEVYASREDLTARGLHFGPDIAAQVLEEGELYRRLVDDVMAAIKVHSF